MSKKTYDVSTPRTGSFSTKRNDSSFSSCLCTMLVILAICSLLLLLSFSLKKAANKKEYKNGRGKFERIIHENASARNDAKEETSQEIIETTQEFARTTQKITSVPPNTEKLKEVTGDSESEETMTVPSTIVTVEEKKDRRFDEAEGSQETTSQITSTQSEFTSNTPPVRETVPSKTILDNGGGTETIFTESTTLNSVEYETTDEKFSAVTQTYFTSEQSTETISTTLEAGGFPQKITELSVETENTPTTQFRTEKIMPSTITSTEETKTIFTDSSTEPEVSSTQSTQEVSQTSTDFTSFKPTTINESDYLDEENNNRNESSKEGNEDFNTLNFKDKDTCSSRKCNKMAARIISFMEPSEKPCNDFYNYACGGIHVDVKEQVDIFESEMSGKETPKFLKDFFNFYRSCKDYEDRFLYKERIEALFKILLRDVAGYDDDPDLEQLLANLTLMESFPYLEIGIDVNPKNSSSFILALRKPKYKAPNSQFWSSFSERRRKCLRKTSEKLNASTSDGSNLYNEYWRCYLNHADYLLTIESLSVEQNDALRKNQTLEEIKQSVGNISKWFLHLDVSLNSPNIHFQSLIKVEELRRKYPILNWRKFFSLISNGDIQGDDIVWIDNNAHFELLMIRMAEIERRDLANILRSIGEYSIFENIILQNHIDSRTEFCKRQAKYLMPDVVNYIYKIIPNSELPERSGYIRNIFDHFKIQFNSSLESSTWIDDDSREAMMEKLQGIRLSLFKTEDYAEERDFLNRIYNGSVIENDYPTNLINLIKHKNQQILSLSGQEVTSAKIHRYLISATDDLPLYIESNGVAYIPYGLIEKASKELPDYIVMAQVGFPLAKIIGQAFSPTNIKNIRMNPETYGQYSHFLNTMRGDGTFSKPFIFNNHSLFLESTIDPYLDDLIVENTALRLLTDRKETFGMQSLLPWISYQFSREKIFFLRLTQELCRKKEVMDVVIETYQNNVVPSPLRILNILSHSEEFSKQFNCDSQSSVFRTFKLQFPYIQMNFDMGLLN